MSDKLLSLGKDTDTCLHCLSVYYPIYLHSVNCSFNIRFLFSTLLCFWYSFEFYYLVFLYTVSWSFSSFPCSVFFLFCCSISMLLLAPSLFCYQIHISILLCLQVSILLAPILFVLLPVQFPCTVACSFSFLSLSLSQFVSWSVFLGSSLISIKFMNEPLDKCY